MEGTTTKKGPRWIDVTGQHFGHVTVLEDLPGQGNNPRIKVRCDCGKVFHAFKGAIKSEKTRSCGKCGLVTRGRPKPHPLYGTRFYTWWKRHRDADRLVPEWRDDPGVAWAYVGELDLWATGASTKSFIARNPDKLIGPENCVVTDSRNPRDLVEINGVARNVTDWGRVIGVTRQRAKQLHDKDKLIERVRDHLKKEESTWRK